MYVQNLAITLSKKATYYISLPDFLMSTLLIPQITSTPHQNYSSLEWKLVSVTTTRWQFK